MRQKRIAVIRAIPGAGHISAALLYLTMGVLAGLVAFGLRGQAPDLRETLRTLRDQSFGSIALLLVAVGSISLLVWRFLQAFADLERKGKTLFGFCQRGRYFVSGIFYGCMPFLVWRMLTGAPIRSGEQTAREVASKVMLIPFGWTLLVLTGLGLIGYGVACVVRAVRGNFERWFHCEQMTAAQKKLLFGFGRLGYAARGLIFLTVGYFVIRSGWHVNPTEISGQAGALHRLSLQPFGPVLLGLVSLGFISFAFFSLGTLRFGKVPVEKMDRLIETAQTKLSSGAAA